MAATFAVAAELSRRGYDVGLTFGNSPHIDLLCAVPKGAPFKVQVKGLSDPNFCMIQEAFFQGNEQDLFLVVVLVPVGGCAFRFFVLSQHDAIREWSELPAVRRDGTPFAKGQEGGLYWRNIEPYEDQWEKLPQVMAVATAAGHASLV